MGSTFERNISLNFTLNATLNSSNPALLRFPSLLTSWIATWTGVYLSLCFEGTLGNLLLVFVILLNTYIILCGINFPILAASERSFPRIEQRRVTTANMMCAAFLWNLLCSLILPVASAFIKISQADIRFQLISIWLATATMLGYAMNPVIFLAMKEDYRLALSRAFCRKTRKIVGSSALGSDTGKSNGTKSRANEGGSNSVTTAQRPAYRMDTAV